MIVVDLGSDKLYRLPVRDGVLGMDGIEAFELPEFKSFWTRLYESLRITSVDDDLINDNDEVIKGLYACGVDACNIYGDTYDFYLPGLNMGFALNSGRLAAEYMAEELNDF